ncbi:MAG TPA: methyltransferase domain-containing protein [Rhizomicrobium sp.]|nr:methyltransferase domain-containing protein [Rhizomicrobium sp.]
MDEWEMAAVRRAFAMQIMASVRVSDPRIQAAFAAVRREEFLGPGPWQIMRWSSVYMPTPSADPVYLYTNDLVAIDPAKQLNNGQPSLHVHLINQAMPAPGEHVVHIGTGTGYYTAILAHLVGEGGRVTGIEFEPEIAARARVNLSPLANVTLMQGDGSTVPFDSADVVYVNAGAARPASSWLDRLKDGGRMVLPLTTEKAFGTLALEQTPQEIARQGAVLRVERRGDEFLAKWISAVAIFPCVGARDEGSEHALAASLANGRLKEVTRLYRHADLPPERIWLNGGDWCLAYS